jgi:hypothetical protein
VVADVAEHSDSEGYDVICTDSLLVLLPREVRPRALAGWRASLRPGGRVVTSLRIGTSPPVDREQRVAGFVERVRAEAASRAGLLDVDADLLATEAEAYARSVAVDPVASVDELEALVAGAGMRIERLSVVDLPGRVAPRQAGPGAFRTGTYARMVAAPA